MKNLNIVLIIVLITALSCKAQHIIPVEEVVDYRGSEGGLLGDRDFVYVKDVNNLLDKFIGVWKGMYNGKNYEFRVVKITRDDGELKEDMLLLRYKITDSTGTILANTLMLDNDHRYVIEGDYLAQTGSYVLNYIGLNSECGQNGHVFISVQATNTTEMRLGLNVHGEMGLDCISPAEQILPVTGGIGLIKQ